VPRSRSLEILAGALALTLTGCASSDGAPGFAVSPERWRVGVARRGVDPAEVPNPMAITPEMEAAARFLSGAGMHSEQLERLRAALQDKREYAIEYERLSTFSAADAFEKRRGNCVSFTNLFIALGRSLGIQLQAALVSSRGSSEREGNLIVTYNHMVAVYVVGGGRAMRVYDFYGIAEEQGPQLTLLDDYAVAAIRSSNDGIARLNEGDTADAVRDLEIAVKLAPSLGSLHANLALARWRADDVPGAFAALARGLAVEPGSPPLLQNLAALYVKEGKPAEARAALDALNVRHASPYALIVRGDLDLRAGDVKAAIRNYRTAASLEPRLAEPWLAIARAELSRGRPEASRKAAKKALKRDPTSREARNLAEAVP
jgi:tetratricopeptide (TPR) repeat protein